MGEIDEKDSINTEQPEEGKNIIGNFRRIDCRRSRFKIDVLSVNQGSVR